MADPAFDAGIADILREVEEGATSRLLAAEAAAAIDDARRANRLFSSGGCDVVLEAA